MKNSEKAIIIFDGECNLCNGVVGWLLRLLPHEAFSYVPFQSTRGQQLLSQHGFPLKRLETVILIENESVLTHSDGFLKIVSRIPKYRLVAALLAFIPRIIRDTIYRYASKNRVKWFGQSNSCTISLNSVPK